MKQYGISLNRTPGHIRMVDTYRLILVGDNERYLPYQNVATVSSIDRFYYYGQFGFVRVGGLLYYCSRNKNVYATNAIVKTGHPLLYFYDGIGHVDRNTPAILTKLETVEWLFL